MGSKGCFLVPGLQPVRFRTSAPTLDIPRPALSPAIGGNEWRGASLFLPCHHISGGVSSPALCPQGLFPCVPNNRVSSSVLPRWGARLCWGVEPSFLSVRGALSWEIGPVCLNVKQFLEFDKWNKVACFVEFPAIVLKRNGRTKGKSWHPLEEHKSFYFTFFRHNGYDFCHNSLNIHMRVCGLHRH